MQLENSKFAHEDTCFLINKLLYVLLVNVLSVQILFCNFHLDLLDA